MPAQSWSYSTASVMLNLLCTAAPMPSATADMESGRTGYTSGRSDVQPHVVHVSRWKTCRSHGCLRSGFVLVRWQVDASRMSASCASCCLGSANPGPRCRRMAMAVDAAWIGLVAPVARNARMSVLTARASASDGPSRVPSSWLACSANQSTSGCTAAIANNRALK